MTANEVVKLYSDKLGVLPDRALAKLAGCSRMTVAAARQKLGIASLKLSPADRAAAAQEGLAKVRYMLGKRPDRELAEIASVSITTIGNERKRLGIAPIPEWLQSGLQRRWREID